jgi:spore maturation protein CgeB
MTNLMLEGVDRAAEAFRNFRKAFPTLEVRFYPPDKSFQAFARQELQGADVVIVHEWNAPDIASNILEFKKEFGFRVLFHDTHHRAYTTPKDILKFPLAEFDGVLAFGEAIRRIYAQGFGVKRAWNFQEAADIARFHPLPAEKDTDVVWVGNWGDEERTRELEEFLIGPAAAMNDRCVAVHGVRYPADALERLAAAGIQFRGYLPNLDAPQAYARSRISVHVPRKFYSNGLSGVPTIRMFEVLACGTPLVCSPWSDTEHLFRPGEDYLCVNDGRSMQSELQHLIRDESARRQLAANGLATIRQRHTCLHRAQQLLDICEELEK